MPILHASLMLLAYSTPWLIPWPYVILIFILYRLQFVFFHQCLLSRAEFGKNGDTFVYHYVKKVFPTVSKKAVDFSVDYIIPIAVIVTAIVIQN